MAPPAPEKPAHTAPPTRDGVLLALLALVVYLAAGRDVFHGIDAHALLWDVHRGKLTHPYHTFYGPAVAAVHAAMTGAGVSVSLYRAALVVSALGAAVAVFCAQRASAAIGQDRGTAAAAALLVAATPGVAFFASIAEVHGLAVAASGLAWIAIARWAARPCSARAALVGGGLVLAFLAHPSAAPLGAAMLPAILLAAPATNPLRRLLSGGTLALSILVAGIVLAPLALHALGAKTSTAVSLDYLAQRASRLATVSRVGKALTWEWLLGTFPSGALLVVVTACSARWRAVAASALLAMAPLVAVGWMMLEDTEIEYGAYTAAILWPGAAIVAVAVRSFALRAALLALALAATALVHAWHGESPRTRDTATAVTSARAAVGASAGTLWLIGNRHDLEAWLVRHGDLTPLALADLVVVPKAQAPMLPELLRRAVRDAANAGQPMLVTTNADDLLAHPGTPGVGHAGSAAEVLRDWITAHRGTAVAQVGGVTVFVLSAGN